MRLADLVASSAAAARTNARLEKIAILAALLQTLSPDEIEIGVAFLIGSPLQGRIGVAGSAIAAVRSVPSAAHPTLDLRDVDRAFGRIATTLGRGSAATRGEALRDLFVRATAAEQDFLIRLLFGELRQGALEGVVIEAVARASGVGVGRLRRATMFAGALPVVARAALVEGEAALSRFAITLFQPLQPMLAESADDVEEALANFGDASLEFKLDGARIQVHKEGDEVRVFTRNLGEVTGAVPEIVEAARTLPARALILDGEAIAFRPDRIPHPFQITMRRFGRKRAVATLRETLPLTPVFFDCLHVDGEDLVDEPYARRAAALEAIAPPERIVPRIVTASPAAAVAFFDRSMAAGHEGLVAKAIDGTYAAGRRGRAWVKVKRARTLDLVVLAAEWGHGRRTGTLSNLHLGARDDQRGGFVMLGKTFKGLTDEALAWQTARLLELEIARDAYTVHVRPELVVEIAFNDIQESPVYPGGLALRFARVKRYREDKTAMDADTLASVQSIYRQTTGSDPPVRGVRL